MTSSLDSRKSRYTAGGTTERGDIGIEWWERVVFPLAADDRVYIVEKRFEGRLDWIADLYLEDPKYWWVIAQYNNILDPHAEIIEGVVLRIPTIERTKALLSGTTGGITSKREVPTAILPIV